MPKFPNFIGGSSATQSLIADAEDTINLYVEQSPSPGATNVAALYPTPGFMQWTSLSTVGDVGSRAAILAEGRLFWVMGGNVYEFDANGTPTKIGPVTVDQNPAQMVFNGKIGGQVGISSGGNIYCLTLGTPATLSGALLTGGYSHIAYAGGFGLAFNMNTGEVNLSNLNDLSTWDPGTFFQRSLFADPWQAMFVDANNLIWLLGSQSFEVWYDTGTGTQPWAPLSGLVGRYGIVAPFAFGLSGAGNFWVTSSPEGLGRIVKSGGSTPQPVSNYAVNTAIAGYLRTAKISDAEILLYEQEGHTSANIAFPSASTTWSYDIEGNGWSKRGRWNVTRGAYDLWSPRVHVIAFGKHLIGDRTTGTIFVMDTTIATEIDATGIRRLRRSPHLNQEHARIALDQIELLMDVGVGVPSGQGTNPQAMLRVSTDGGRTWGNERRASIGRLGEYKRRVYWSRLGAPSDAVIEVTYADPTPFRIVDCWVNNKEAIGAAA